MLYVRAHGGYLALGLRSTTARSPAVREPNQTFHDPALRWSLANNRQGGYEYLDEKREAPEKSEVYLSKIIEPRH